jgi:hypothetical protein
MTFWNNKASYNKNVNILKRKRIRLQINLHLEYNVLSKNAFFDKSI